MNLHVIAVCFSVLIIGMGATNYAFGLVDPLTEIYFLESGLIHSDEYQFHISNEMNIREFFNGNIIRISGQTIEGFPYITYTKIIDENMSIKGKIFINGKFFELKFYDKEIPIEKNTESKKDDLLILTKYSQKVYSTHPVQFQIKIFDLNQNHLNDFYQNYGMVKNTQVDILIKNNEETIFSDNLMVNDKGLVETEFEMPFDKITTYLVTITAENNESKSSKKLQLINLGSKGGLK